MWSYAFLIPLDDQPPDGLDDVAAEQGRRHVNVLGEPPGGQFQGTPPRSL
jgi:hypothetical protein